MMRQVRAFYSSLASRFITSALESSLAFLKHHSKFTARARRVRLEIIQLPSIWDDLVHGSGNADELPNDVKVPYVAFNERQKHAHANDICMQVWLVIMIRPFCATLTRTRAKDSKNTWQTFKHLSIRETNKENARYGWITQRTSARGFLHLFLLAKLTAPRNSLRPKGILPPSAYIQSTVF